MINQERKYFTLQKKFARLKSNCVYNSKTKIPKKFPSLESRKSPKTSENTVKKPNFFKTPFLEKKLSDRKLFFENLILNIKQSIKLDKGSICESYENQEFSDMHMLFDLNNNISNKALENNIRFSEEKYLDDTIISPESENLFEFPESSSFLVYSFSSGTFKVKSFSTPKKLISESLQFKDMENKSDQCITRKKIKNLKNTSKENQFVQMEKSSNDQSHVYSKSQDSHLVIGIKKSNYVENNPQTNTSVIQNIVTQPLKDRSQFLKKLKMQESDFGNSIFLSDELSNITDQRNGEKNDIAYSDLLNNSEKSVKSLKDLVIQKSDILQSTQEFIENSNTLASVINDHSLNSSENSRLQNDHEKSKESNSASVPLDCNQMKFDIKQDIFLDLDVHSILENFTKSKIVKLEISSDSEFDIPENIEYLKSASTKQSINQSISKSQSYFEKKLEIQNESFGKFVGKTQKKPAKISSVVDFYDLKNYKPDNTVLYGAEEFNSTFMKKSNVLESSKSFSSKIGKNFESLEKPKTKTLKTDKIESKSKFKNITGKNDLKESMKSLLFGDDEDNKANKESTLEDIFQNDKILLRSALRKQTQKLDLNNQNSTNKKLEVSNESDIEGFSDFLEYSFKSSKTYRSGVKKSRVGELDGEVMQSFDFYDELIIGKSRIHGLGIFTPVEIKKDTLIMEYKGEIIGKCMSDKREKFYRKNNLDSVYMFTVTEDMIIDATMTGNKARYINHSCNPNCQSLTSMSDKSIKYCSIRDIKPYEELTINYYMPLDDSSNVCMCGDSQCTSKINKSSE